MESITMRRHAVSTDLRISTLPTIFGEKVVLRLLGNDRDNSLMDIKRLGMNEEQREVFERILKVPHGIVLVTGPTGSGKTTTLYAVLSRIVQKEDQRGYSGRSCGKKVIDGNHPGADQSKIRPYICHSAPLHFKTGSGCDHGG